MYWRRAIGNAVIYFSPPLRYRDFATVGNHDALVVAPYAEDDPRGRTSNRALGSVPCRINPREMCFASLVVRYLIASVFIPRSSASAEV